MAEGGYGLDMDDIYDEDINDEVTNDKIINDEVINAQGQTFNNRAFDANYNIEAHLNEGVNFQAAEDPALREIIQSVNASKADEVPSSELTKIQLDLAGKADEAFEKELGKMISMALIGAKGWDGVTETGIKKLADSERLKKALMALYGHFHLEKKLGFKLHKKKLRENSMLKVLLKANLVLVQRGTFQI